MASCDFVVKGVRRWPVDKLHVDSPDLLVGWKDIAAYLKCSVRKAQRLEQRELPVNRIPGTKSVWALKSEVGAWLSRQAEMTKRAKDQSAVTVDSARLPPGGLSRKIWIRLLALGGLLVLTILAAVESTHYALTIV